MSADEIRVLRSQRDELAKALIVARRWLVEGSPELGWNIDRLAEVIATLPPVCSICRSRHGLEITHACE